MQQKLKKPDFVCPNCGGTVPGQAKACPHCGSDEQTGWAANAEFAHLDPSFDNEDYAEAVKTEFGARKSKSLWAVLIPIVSAVLIALWLYHTVF